MGPVIPLPFSTKDNIIFIVSFSCYTRFWEPIVTLHSSILYCLSIRLGNTILFLLNLPYPPRVHHSIFPFFGPSLNPAKYYYGKVLTINPVNWPKERKKAMKIRDLFGTDGYSLVLDMRLRI